ncbi:MAG TPA: DMT family transporter [Vineibacter sp.]|nr:DMT family transporter [Vineibacter sp.]
MTDARVGPALQLGLAMAIAGTIGLFVKESGVGALNAVFWRCAIGAVAMLVFCVLAGYLRRPFGSRRDVVLTVIGGLCIVANWVLGFEALASISITLMTIVYHVQPFWVLFLVWFVFRDAPTRDHIVWVLLAFAGLVLAVGFDPGLEGEASAVLLGAGLSLAASLLYAGAVVAAKAITQTRPAVVTLAHTIIGVALMAPLATPSAQQLVSPAWPWLIGLGVLHTGIVYVLMYAAYPRLSGAAIAALTFIYPVTALIADAWVYDVRMTPAQIAGMLAIATATIAVNRNWPIRWPLMPRRDV